jgi:uncharacterized protein YkwD
MASLVPPKYFKFLIPLIIFASACTQTPQATSVPTRSATATLTPETPEPQVVILESQVIVDQISLMDPDPDTGQIEVTVKGATSNTCTSVDGISITKQGNVFSVNIETTTTPGSECQQKAVSFEETVMLDAQDLEPGVYLVTSGTAQTFEVAATQPTGEPGASTGNTSEETSTQEMPTATPQPSSDEPRDCQDDAVFVADVTYPDNTSVAAGEIFTKTWEIRNNGTCNWGTGYELEFVRGSFAQVVPLDDPFPAAAPQESVELSVAVTAPTTAGTHSGVWVIKRPEGDTIQTEDGQAFDFWAIVVVPSARSVTTPTENREVNADGVVCAQGNSAYVDQLLQLVNAARAANGLPAYELQSQLSSSAKVLANDMACNDFVSHTGSDGSTWFDRITAQGYNYADAAENIFFGYGTVPQLAMNWWMDDQIHRDNILNDSFTQIGIAYALNPQTGGSYYTLDFARPAE